MELEKTKEWETERLLVVQQLISEQHDNGISMLFSLKGLRRTRFQIPSIDTFSVTKTTFFRELKRKRKLVGRAEKKHTRDDQHMARKPTKITVERKKTLDLSLSLSLFLSLSTSGPLCLPLSLSISGNYFDCKRKGKILTDIFKDDDVGNNNTNNSNNRWTIQNKFR